MPIEYQIDHRRRLVVAKGQGRLTDEDVFGYQLQVWSQPEVEGYNELVDMSEVEHIVVPSAARIKELAELSAGMDPPGKASNFAIVASEQIANELGQLFRVYRQLDPRSTKKVAVFKSVVEALQWLCVHADVP